MQNNRESAIVSERRTEVRLDGKQVEGIQVCLIDPRVTEGWDQNQRWECKMHNLSAGGVEVLCQQDNLCVDQMLIVHMTFPKNQEELPIPAMVRHVHHVQNGKLIGLQFLWNHKDIKEMDLEYQFCNQLLWCERRGI